MQYMSAKLNSEEYWRKGQFYYNWLKDNQETHGNYPQSREQIVPAICKKKKKTSKELLTRFFLVVKIVSTILMLENYENHLQMFTSSNKEQMLSFFACFNNYPLHSHVVQLEHLKKDLAIAGFPSPKSLQANLSSIVYYCYPRLVTILSRTFSSDPYHLIQFLELHSCFLK